MVFVGREVGFEKNTTLSMEVKSPGLTLVEFVVLHGTWGGPILEGRGVQLLCDFSLRIRENMKEEKEAEEIFACLTGFAGFGALNLGPYEIWGMLVNLPKTNVNFILKQDAVLRFSPKETKNVT